MPIDIDMDEIAELFIEESTEGLDIMESGLLNLDLGAADPETMNSIFRAAHSIKGGGATFGFTEVSDFAHHVETLLDEMRTGQRAVCNDGVDLLLQSVDCIREMVSCLGKGPVTTTRADELKIQLEVMLQNKPAPEASTEQKESVTEETASTMQSPQVSEYTIQFAPHPGIFKSCNDPLRMLRELATLGDLEVCSEGHEALALEGMDPEECLLSWRLKLTGEVTISQIKEVFAWVEDECDLDITLVEPGAAQADTTPSNESEAINPSPQPPVAVTKPAPVVKAAAVTKEASSIRVDIDKVDALINLVGELVITQSMLGRYAGNFDFTQLEGLREGLTQLVRNTRDLQESVMAIRMLPISHAFSRFPRLVRDTGKALGKKFELKLVGEHTELDKTVLEKIGDPLVHLVRNSLDHGLETPDVRVAAGKPETGVLELSAYHEGGNIVIEVNDDGAGINAEKVLNKARERGLVGPEEQLSAEGVSNLIFMPGFSTVDKVSDLSGRGVGMDVVRRNITELGGHVSVKSETGIGSTFTIRLPLTMAILDGQLIRVGKECYIISLVSIVETIQSKAEKISEIAGQTELFKLRDEYLPVVRLHNLFGIEADSTHIDDGLLVVVEAAGQRVGIFVDDLLDQQQVVIKSLEANYRQMPGISGATILGDGSVALILDVPGLIQLFFDSERNQQHHATGVA